MELYQNYYTITMIIKLGHRNVGSWNPQQKDKFVYEKPTNLVYRSFCLKIARVPGVVNFHKMFVHMR